MHPEQSISKDAASWTQYKTNIMCTEYSVQSHSVQCTVYSHTVYSVEWRMSENNIPSLRVHCVGWTVVNSTNYTVYFIPILVQFNPE